MVRLDILRLRLLLAVWILRWRPAIPLVGARKTVGLLVLRMLVGSHVWTRLLGRRRWKSRAHLGRRQMSAGGLARRLTARCNGEGNGERGAGGEGRRPRQSTYMIRWRVRTVCRLLRRWWLPMGRKLALATLVWEHVEVGCCYCAERVVDVCLIKCRPATWSCHANIKGATQQERPRDSAGGQWTGGGWWCEGSSGAGEVSRRAARSALQVERGQCKMGDNCRAKRRRGPGPSGEGHGNPGGVGEGGAGESASSADEGVWAAVGERGQRLREAFRACGSGPQRK